MKIKKKDAICDYASLAVNKEINAELVGSSDRVAGIVAATILDIHLGRLLSLFFIDDKKEVDALLSSDIQSAPLSGFSARARAAYCLGLVSKEEFQDISTIREIRNICAHHLFECNFEIAAIKSACDNFTIFSYLVEFPAAALSRTKFNFAVCVLDSLLEARGKMLVRRSPAARFQKGKSA
jgi:DNA-binding MltR family transcriptional regulator